MEFQSGAQNRKKDLRDVMLGKIQAPISLPETYQTDISKVTTAWQGHLGTCGAHAGAHLSAILKSIQTNTPQYLSPRYLWDEIKLIDGFALDIGTDLRSILKTLSNWGDCDYSLLPNDYSQTIEQYSDSSVITEEMKQNGQTRVILPNYGFTDTPSLEQLKQDIYQNKAVLILIRCDDGFFGTYTPTFTTKKYGHFVVAYGWDKDGILIIDSSEENIDLRLKNINFQYVSFIEEDGSSCEAPVGYVDGLKQQVKYLQIILQLWQTLLGLLKK